VINPAKAKVSSWTAAAVLGTVLCLYVAWNIQRFPARASNVSTERMEQVLNNTPEIVKSGSDSLVEYGQVRAAMIDWAWNAPPPPAVPEHVAEAAPAEPATQTVDKLVKVLGYSVDVAVPENSKAILKYLPESKVRPPPRDAGAQLREGTLKLAGERLDDPIGHIRVVSITPAGVEFGFDEPGRATETLLPADFDLSQRMAYVDLSELAVRADAIPIPRRAYSAPTETVQIGQNRFRIGTEDAQLIAEDFPRILSEEVVTTRHRNPTTGRYDGIELTKVAPGSIAERHGAQAGDVIKSINGHPVTSQAEAINFVKTNAEMYDKWEVVVSNLGQERTITFYPPEK
jgi:hypothetical protein